MQENLHVSTQLAHGDAERAAGGRGGADSAQLHALEDPREHGLRQHRERAGLAGLRLAQPTEGFDRESAFRGASASERREMRVCTGCILLCWQIRSSNISDFVKYFDQKLI